MRKLRYSTGIIAGVCLTVAAPARGDVVADWNAVAVMYVSDGNAAATPPIPAGRGGPPGLLDLALVHLAIHDAVQAIEGRFQPYHYSDPTKLGVGSPAAAAAAAAHRTLVLLYPAQQAGLDTFYNAYLSAHGLTGNAGLAAGEAAAAALHASHYRPTPMIPGYFGGSEPGQWRSAVPMAFLFLATTNPFALNRPSQFRPPPPPPMHSEQYYREYEEVEAAGSAAAHPNPLASETLTARFWSVNFVSQWNETLRRIASAHLDVGNSARLFALANMAAADAAIAVWESKYFYSFWRPDTAIRNGDVDGNRRTVKDAAWTPLIANPPYPDYVSGANGLTGAFTGMLRRFLGTDEFSFSVKTTSSLVPVALRERNYQSFSEAAQEVVEARILLGIHFRSADEEARRLGERVAHWTFQKFLRPAPGN